MRFTLSEGTCTVAALDVPDEPGESRTLAVERPGPFSCPIIGIELHPDGSVSVGHWPDGEQWVAVLHSAAPAPTPQADAEPPQPAPTAKPCGWECGDDAPDHQHYAVLVREHDGTLLGRLKPDGNTTRRKTHAAILSRERADTITEEINEAGHFAATTIHF